jgi:hypothetical protein
MKTQMEKQTALDWLVEQIVATYANIEKKENLFVLTPTMSKELFEKAKEMEREQIMEAFDNGQEYEYQYHINLAPRCDSETYFDETYGGDK